MGLDNSDEEQKSKATVNSRDLLHSAICALQSLEKPERLGNGYLIVRCESLHKAEKCTPDLANLRNL